MDNLLLQIKNVAITFNTAGVHTTVVDGINLAITQGQMLAIVGESGSGKSVTALALLQLLPSTAHIQGQLIFTPTANKSVDITTLTAPQIAAIRGNKIAMIFQEPMTALNPLLTCGTQVAEVLQLHLGLKKNEAKKRVIELFAQVQLPQPEKMYSRYPHQLSGGQKQRVMIAMAISCNPALLIADEPTTALDVTVQHDIMQLLQHLQTTLNMSVLIITHDFGIVADYANDVAVMYKGKIVEYGPTNIVLNSPQHNYTKALLACRPIGHAAGTVLPIVSDFLTETNELVAPQKIAAVAKVITSLSTTNETPALIVENLKVHYAIKNNWFAKKEEPFKAVDDISFTVPKGKTIGLVGESGSGKTTVGRAILQLIQPTAGNIIVNGKNISALSKQQVRHLRKELQIVFQDPYGSLNPRLTIGSAIQEPMQVHALFATKQQQKDKVIELLEKVNLQANHFNRYPHQFSGGQRQRICIARALALHPSFLIFDESVSALDVSVQAQVLNLLNSLKAEFNFSSIFISHDLGVVKYISDEILVMHKGKIIERGLADEVYNNPKQSYTQQLIAAIPGKKLIKY
jgi:peptide/nickel transport system ATP-binding protein